MRISVNVSWPELSDHECVTSASPGHFLFLEQMAAPDCAPEPSPAPICRDTPLCEGCPYPATGFVCHGADGRCLRAEMEKIYEKRRKSDASDTE